ncbi:MAG: hypothetical protein JWQ62_2605 [Lacunisphaera sp.]|nr:hypothetical protein [Lacunisphaera sp.]
MTSRPFLAGRFAATAAILLGPLPAWAAQKSCEVAVNVEVTAAGKKILPPSPAHPAYYFPVVGGFREEGAVKSGEKAPERPMVLHRLATTLAAQGYLVVGPQTPPPSVLLAFHWGSMNPQIDEFGDLEDPQKLFYNQREMVSLVGGHTLGNLDLWSEREAVMQGAEEDRYFVVVSAFDFDAAQKKQKVLLWRAKMSTGSAGGSMEDVVAALITAGGPHFGRETLRPAWETTPLENRGQVNLGELQVKEYMEPAKAPAPPPKKP